MRSLTGATIDKEFLLISGIKYCYVELLLLYKSLLGLGDTTSSKTGVKLQGFA